MYKSVEQVRKLREEKMNALSMVYRSNNLDTVYANQKQLGAMSIGIFTDVAAVVLPSLHEDGVDNIVWSNISLQLNKLSFKGIPTAEVIREKYQQSINNPTVVRINGEDPKPGTKTKIKKISLPEFLLMLTGQGIAVPLILNSICGSKLALVKILIMGANAAFMIIEVIHYFDFIPKTSKITFPSSSQKIDMDNIDYDDMCKRAIQEVYKDNRQRLDDWFDRLEIIIVKEIDKALGEEKGHECSI